MCRPSPRPPDGATRASRLLPTARRPPQQFDLSDAMKHGFVRASGYRRKTTEVKLEMARSWRKTLM